jgi:hypothetical protein
MSGSDTGEKSLVEWSRERRVISKVERGEREKIAAAARAGESSLSRPLTGPDAEGGSDGGALTGRSDGAEALGPGSGLGPLQRQVGDFGPAVGSGGERVV